MELSDALRNRRSVRDFNSRPVEFEKLTLILEAGLLAPSAGDNKDFKFILISDKDLIKQISEISQSQYWIAKASAVIVVVSDYVLTKEHYKERGERLYSVQSSAAAIQNMLLKITSLGLSACWVGAFDEDRLNGLLGISGDARPQALIPIGYSDVEFEEREEIDMANYVYFNSFGNKVKNINLVTKQYSKEIEKIVSNNSSWFDDLSNKLKNYFKK